ncbi:hypothetical protein T492DRAFT_847049 [Pavlovales sp. CCMP2436]|nr:hypothetical protein T492DRAFT_847049 [Pavlovales sp. CCMP2436]
MNPATLERYKSKALHLGRESQKFTFHLQVLEASGLPQAALSTTTGDIALQLSRGVKVARTSSTRANAGVARWHGEEGLASIVVTLYKSHDKVGTGKAFSSKPYKLSLVALGESVKSLNQRGLPGAKPRPNLELGSAELDLAKLAPTGALLSPPTAGGSSLQRELELDFISKTGGASRVRVRVRAQAHTAASGAFNTGGAAGVAGATGAGGAASLRDAAADDSSGDDGDGSVSSRLARYAPRSPGRADARADSNRSSFTRDAAGAEEQRREELEEMQQMKDGLESELERRRSRRQQTPSKGGTPVGGGGGGGSSAALASSQASELLRLRDEKSALASELEQLRNELTHATARVAEAEVAAERSADAAASADARALDAAEDAAAAREEAAAAAGADSDARLAEAEGALANALADAAQKAELLADETDRRVAAEAAAAASRAEKSSGGARSASEEAKRTAAEAKVAAHLAHLAPAPRTSAPCHCTSHLHLALLYLACAPCSSCADCLPPPPPNLQMADGLRAELVALRVEWDTALSRVSSSAQLKVDALKAAKEKLEARETELHKALAGARDELGRERRRADDAALALDGADEALAAERSQRAMAEAEASAREAVREEGARALQMSRVEVQQTQIELAAALEALARAETAAGGGGGAPPSEARRATRDLDSESEPESQEDERDERLFELTLELVDLTALEVKNAKLLDELERVRGVLKRAEKDGFVDDDEQ